MGGWPAKLILPVACLVPLRPYFTLKSNESLKYLQCRYVVSIEPTFRCITAAEYGVLVVVITLKNIPMQIVADLWIVNGAGDTFIRRHFAKQSFFGRVQLHGYF